MNSQMKRTTMVAAATMLAVCGATSVMAAGKPTTECREAEANFSESQVFAAEAYASNDFDKAKAAIEKAKASLQKGRDGASGCGCQGALEPAKTTAEQLDDALQTSHFSEVQERLYTLIGSGEKARAAAETCWRQAATGGATPATAPPAKPTAGK